MCRCTCITLIAVLLSGYAEMSSGTLTPKTNARQFVRPLQPLTTLELSDSPIQRRPLRSTDSDGVTSGSGMPDLPAATNNFIGPWWKGCRFTHGKTWYPKDQTALIGQSVKFRGPDRARKYPPPYVYTFDVTDESIPCKQAPFEVISAGCPNLNRGGRFYRSAEWLEGSTEYIPFLNIRYVDSIDDGFKVRYRKNTYGYESGVGRATNCTYSRTAKLSVLTGQALGEYELDCDKGISTGDVLERSDIEALANQPGVVQCFGKKISTSTYQNALFLNKDTGLTPLYDYLSEEPKCSLIAVIDDSQGSLTLDRQISIEPDQKINIIGYRLGAVSSSEDEVATGSEVEPGSGEDSPELFPYASVDVASNIFEESSAITCQTKSECKFENIRFSVVGKTSTPGWGGEAIIKAEDGALGQITRCLWQLPEDMLAVKGTGENVHLKDNIIFSKGGKVMDGIYRSCSTSTGCDTGNSCDLDLNPTSCAQGMNDFWRGVVSVSCSGGTEQGSESSPTPSPTPSTTTAVPATGVGTTAVPATGVGTTAVPATGVGTTAAGVGAAGATSLSVVSLSSASMSGALCSAYGLCSTPAAGVGGGAAAGVVIPLSAAVFLVGAAAVGGAVVTEEYIRYKYFKTGWTLFDAIKKAFKMIDKDVKDRRFLSDGIHMKPIESDSRSDPHSVIPMGAEGADNFAINKQQLEAFYREDAETIKTDDVQEE